LSLLSGPVSSTSERRTAKAQPPDQTEEFDQTQPQSKSAGARPQEAPRRASVNPASEEAISNAEIVEADADFNTKIAAIIAQLKQ
jgi:hypothetical protein